MTPLPQSFEMHTGWTAAHCSGSGHTMPLEHTRADGWFEHAKTVMHSARLEQAKKYFSTRTSP
jgi:hypothetical protein